MNIKRFIADSSQEALRLIKKEMGPDAVILRTRTVGSKVSSNGKDRQVEVTAAVDYEAPVVTTGEGSSASTVATDALLEKWKSLESEIRDIKASILSADVGRRLAPELYFNKPIRALYSHLRAFGLRPVMIEAIMNEATREFGSGASNAEGTLKQSLARVIKKIEIRPTGTSRGTRRVFSFIGPTGVGKTTTLAKLAAIHAVKEGTRTALITLDTFRIAAVKQLQTYARIMGVPLEVASGRHEMDEAIRRHRDCELILIDTAGKSPNAEEAIGELARFFRDREEVHPFLVLSATTDFSSLLRAAQQFRGLSYESVIFTKLDEVLDASSMLNFLLSMDVPAAYFTTGQQVPEDIEPATRKRIAQLILSGLKNQIGISCNSDEVAEYGSGNRPQVLGRGLYGRG